MSYEGYTEYLCKDGHYSTSDCWCENLSCPICNKEVVWKHEVDQTNDEGNPAIPKLKVKRKAIYKTCPCCKAKEIDTHAEFFIPKKIGYKVDGNGKLYWGE